MSLHQSHKYAIHDLAVVLDHPADLERFCEALRRVRAHHFDDLIVSFEIVDGGSWIGYVVITRGGDCTKECGNAQT